MMQHSATTVSVPATNYLPFSSRPDSLSSASVVTVKRSASPGGHTQASIIHMRPHSPAESGLLASRALKTLPVQPVGQTKGVRVERGSTVSEGVGVGNRWSHSTAGGAPYTSNAVGARNQSAPPHNMQQDSLWVKRNPNASPVASPRQPSQSPRASPQRYRPPSAALSEKLRHKVPATNSLRNRAPAPRLQLPPRSLWPSDHRSPKMTPSSPGHLTPSGYTSQPMDYFGIAVTKDAAKEDASPVDPHAGHSRFSHLRKHIKTVPGQKSPADKPISPIQKPVDKLTKEEEEEAEIARRRSRTRERRERDKKTMLSKALEKANTAVVLDNAQNFEGALDAYKDACKLLKSVMNRTAGDEDRAKLDAIRETYKARVGELLMLQSPDATENTKQLPPRPMSNGSEDMAHQSEPFSPSSPIEEVVTPADTVGIAEMADNSIALHGAPSSSRQAANPSQKTRDSFLTTAIKEVEGGSSSAFLGPLWERSKSPALPTLEEPESPEHMDTSYIPRPLTPSRPLSPVPPPKDEKYQRNDDDAKNLASKEDNTQNEANAVEAGSWLDTIDESGSSRSSSVHSGSPGQGLHRKDLRAATDDTHADFDAAFDAAVEAAYEEGYEPDSDFQDKTVSLPALPALPAHGHLLEKSQPLPPLPRPDPQVASSANYLYDEEAEEHRMLDEITRDYMNHGFDFNIQSKSSLPRESDSSGYTGNTWQSSMLSERATANTSLSTLPENVNRVRSSTRGTDYTTASSSSAMSEDGMGGLMIPGVNMSRPLSQTGSQILQRRSHRFSGPILKPLTIETSARASSRHSAREPERSVSHDRSRAGSETAIDNSNRISVVPSLRRVDDAWTPQPASAVSDSTNSMSINGSVPPSSAGMDVFGDMQSPKPGRFLRKNKSSLSLRDHGSMRTPIEGENALATPFTATFPGPSRKDSTFSNGRAHAASSAGTSPFPDFVHVGGMHLFDTSLSLTTSEDIMQPPALEPCPESYLLRPFWLLRTIASTVTSTRGAYLTTKLFMPHEAWLNRSIKLKNVEDKASSCDLLTAALSRLGNVDSYDADAVLEELQGFEEILDRVQVMLVKRLGGEVGVHGVSSLFKDAGTSSAPAPADGSGTTPPETSRESKTNSGKSYLSGWRKLRGKNSINASTGGVVGATRVAEGSIANMSTVPMTAFVGVEKRTNTAGTAPPVAPKRHMQWKESHFEGPLAGYMASIARLAEASSALDQIARQVEDPGLKHSSTTHVGLELSTRHAAEFFGFYVCRFLLADVGTLVDKYVKRSSEWVMQ